MGLKMIEVKDPSPAGTIIMCVKTIDPFIGLLQIAIGVLVIVWLERHICEYVTA